VAKEDYRARIKKFAIQFIDRLTADIFALPSKPSGKGTGRRRLGMDGGAHKETEFELLAEHVYGKVSWLQGCG
jgi:hypothetical protein